MIPLPIFIALIALVLCPICPAQARPGEVKLVETDRTAVLSNGLISVTINKSGANIQSIQFKGTEFVRQTRGGAYYSMDGGKSFRVPSGCVFRIHHQAPGIIDVAMKQTWTTQRQAVDLEFHYVLRAGDTGLYCYAIASHPASYPATSFSEWRMVWKVPDDLFDTICVDRLRFHEMPTAAELDNADPTPIKEITKIKTGKWAGRFHCKYDYNADYHITPFWGHTHSKTGFSAWMICGSHEWKNDGPTKQDLTSADRIMHLHFGLNHYNASSTRIPAGQEWRKTYGPFLLYVNQVPGGPNAAVRDARLRAEAEKAAWPYAWLPDSPDTPSLRSRGSATGKFILRDPAKPTLTAANAWIGLAQPDPGGNWQFESNRYQYWTKVKADGTFTIPPARPGTYTLYAFADGAFGEFEHPGVEIRAGQTTPLGDLVWSIPRDRGRLVWEIGVPNRRADEFRHGDSYFQGYLWKSFAKEWPNPLEFHVGRSDPAKDWNFAHSAYIKPGATPEPWKWRVHFNLDSAPAGDATLTIGIASADGARLPVFLNDESRPIETVNPSVQGGNALLREGIHGKYCVHTVKLPANRLKVGDNTLTFVQSRLHSPGFHVMYDALSLEVP